MSIELEFQAYEDGGRRADELIDTLPHPAEAIATDVAIATTEIRDTIQYRVMDMAHADTRQIPVSTDAMTEEILAIETRNAPDDHEADIRWQQLKVLQYYVQSYGVSLDELQHLQPSGFSSLLDMLEYLHYMNDTVHKGDFTPGPVFYGAVRRHTEKMLSGEIPLHHRTLWLHRTFTPDTDCIDEHPDHVEVTSRVPTSFDELKALAGCRSQCSPQDKAIYQFIEYLLNNTVKHSTQQLREDDFAALMVFAQRYGHLISLSIADHLLDNGAASYLVSEFAYDLITPPDDFGSGRDGNDGGGGHGPDDKGPDDDSDPTETVRRRRRIVQLQRTVRWHSIAS